MGKFLAGGKLASNRDSGDRWDLASVFIVRRGWFASPTFPFPTKSAVTVDGIRDQFRLSDQGRLIKDAPWNWLQRRGEIFIAWKAVVKGTGENPRGSIGCFLGNNSSFRKVGTPS